MHLTDQGGGVVCKSWFRPNQADGSTGYC